MLNVRTEIDLSGVYAMVETFERGLDDAERFAINKIQQVVRTEIIPTAVPLLCTRAGPGWPDVYTEHLLFFMQINTQVEAITLGEGRLEVGVDFGNLGDYSDLERGFHHQALIAIEPGVTKSGKAKYTMNVPKVNLPYGGEPLMNEKDRRAEFWETAIVNQEPFVTNLRRGAGHLVIENAPTFEEVAAARVDAWISLGKAPQWLLLENGYSEYEPEIYPVDFSESLSAIIGCVASTIYEGALLTLIELAEQAGSVRVVGQSGPRSGTTGKFIAYRDVLSSRIDDYSGCIGDL